MSPTHSKPKVYSVMRNKTKFSKQNKYVRKLLISLHTLQQVNSCQYSPPTLFWELLPSWGEQAFFLCCVVVVVVEDAPLSQTTSVH